MFLGHHCFKIHIVVEYKGSCLNCDLFNADIQLYTLRHFLKSHHLLYMATAFTARIPNVTFPSNGKLDSPFKKTSNPWLGLSNHMWRHIYSKIHELSTEDLSVVKLF